MLTKLQKDIQEAQERIRNAYFADLSLMVKSVGVRKKRNKLAKNSRRRNR